MGLAEPGDQVSHFRRRVFRVASLVLAGGQACQDSSGDPHAVPVGLVVGQSTIGRVYAVAPLCLVVVVC